MVGNKGERWFEKEENVLEVFGGVLALCGWWDGGGIMWWPGTYKFIIIHLSITHTTQNTDTLNSQQHRLKSTYRNISAAAHYYYVLLCVDILYNTEI